MRCTNTLLNERLSSIHYSTTERNAAHETLIDCHSCSQFKQKKCRKSMRHNNKGTPNNKKTISKAKRERYEYKPNTPAWQPPVLNIPAKPNNHWQLLSSKTGFTGALTGKIVSGRKQAKITKIIYGRTRDRYQEQIHS